MTELSPAAQAVFDAYLNAPCGKHRQSWVAAALRAAADQVVPEPDAAAQEALSIAALRPRWQIRDRLLAIADELEAQ